MVRVAFLLSRRPQDQYSGDRNLGKVGSGGQWAKNTVFEPGRPLTGKKMVAKYECFCVCILNCSEEGVEETVEHQRALACLQTLLALQASTPVSPSVYGLLLRQAASVGSDAALRILLLNCATQSSLLQMSKMRALQLAARNGYLNSVRLLVESGANAMRANGQGQTALDLAVANDHKDIVNFLLSHIIGRQAGMLERTSTGRPTISNCGPSGKTHALLRPGKITTGVEPTKLRSSSSLSFLSNYSVPPVITDCRRRFSSRNDSSISTGEENGTTYEMPPSDDDESDTLRLPNPLELGSADASDSETSLQEVSDTESSRLKYLSKVEFASYEQKRQSLPPMLFTRCEELPCGASLQRFPSVMPSPRFAFLGVPTSPLPHSLLLPHLIPVSRQSQEDRKCERAQVAGAAGAAPGCTTTPGSDPTE
ncbi:unnamed protein product [Schistocephalus solidus]|uniref:ANK_REP_REGION domain-containing protein n=1 Tax=Schistocephalus solidus TaxID=70667 RepID=A0A183SVZ8_SCHSO|nr:unnamed protein product [Schistocephalus solidus]